MKKILFVFAASLLFLSQTSFAQAATCAAPDRCDAKCAAGETSVNKTCATKGQVCCSKSTTGTAAGTTTGTGTTATGGTQTAPPQAPVSISFENPLKFNTVEGVITSVMGGIQGLVGTIALLMIVVGAIMYVLSFGDEGKIKKAKALITAALIGIVIVIAAPAFLKEIANLLGWGGDVTGVDGATSFSLTQIATKVLQFLLSIIGTLALIMLIIGAIMYLTSAGNENQAKKARSVITAAFIGITIAMASLVVISQLASFFQ